jgi:membrane protease YdiL (CAAX protease family)
MAVVLSTLLYATAALALAARIFGAEAVLYSEQGGWSDLFRRPSEPRPVASVVGALSCVALMFPADFLGQALLGRALDLPPAGRLALQALFTILLFGAIPLLAAAIGRVRVGNGFLLRPAPWPTYLAAVVLGVSLWPFALSVLLALRNAGSLTFGPEHEKAVGTMLAQLRQLSPTWIVLGFALVPAIFEELFFRGYLFSALRTRTGPATTIVVSAGLFALFHSFFTLDQVATSMLLGLVLGWVCWKTASVVPGMIIHACHNTLVILALYYQKEISSQGWFDLNAKHLPAVWIIGALVGVGLGATLIWWGTNLRPRKQEPKEVPVSV